jgi:hypothetical protein
MQKYPRVESEATWTHRECFIRTLCKETNYIQVNEIENFGNIRVHNQSGTIRIIQEAIDENENRSESKAKRSKLYEFEELQEIESVRDLLQQCDIKDLKLLLQKNNYCSNYQNVATKNAESLLDLCSEFLIFGVLEKCDKCGDGEMIIAKFGYKCNGWINGWIKCENFEEKPKRRICTIPEGLRVNNIWKQIEPKLKDCVLRQRNVNHSEVPKGPCDSTMFRVTDFDLHQETPKAPEFSVSLKMIRNNRRLCVYDFIYSHLTEVYCTSDCVFNCVLALVDIEKNQNDFFKMQIVIEKRKDQERPKFFLLESSGRMGSQFWTEFNTCYSAAEAIKIFEKKILEKTGAEWISRDQMKRIPGKFYPCEVDFANGTRSRLHEKRTTLKLPLIESKCHLNLCDLLNVYSCYKYSGEPTTVPISLQQEILSTFSELELNAHNAKSSKNVAIGLSNKFFTLMPQNFGLEAPPILDTAEKIKKLREYLGYSLESFEHHRCVPKINIEVLDQDTDDHRLISTYYNNTLQGYRFDLLEVFKVNRIEDEARHEPYKNFPGRMLLWHGSHISSFKPILENGLRFPSEAYRIGFTDTVRSAIDNCQASLYERLLALCEVTLGNISQNFDGNAKMRLPDGFDSVQTCGGFKPTIIIDDGVEVPLGMVGNTDEASSLYHNEFFVYDERQIKLKYLIKFSESQK